jgi:hypothetical protein
MRVPRRETQHAVAAETRDQTVDQLGHRFVLDGAPVQAGLMRVQRLADRDGEADRVEAEARVKRVRQRVDAALGRA